MSTDLAKADQRHRPMANDNGAIGEAAYCWIARLLSGDISDNERARYAAWMAADARHRRQSRELLEMIDGIDDVLARDQQARARH